MKTYNFNNKGNILIGLVVVFIAAGLVSGGLYFYLKQSPKILEITEESTKEEVSSVESLGQEKEILEITEKSTKEKVSLTESLDKGKNEKNNTKFSAKEVFLISDENWQDVLTFISVAIWGENNQTKKYPILIYHKENNSFDADSILYFIEQYGTRKVTAINNLSQELINIIKNRGLTFETINSNDYPFYWESFEDVVYVENNYELALLSSTYASLINAPLIISGSSLDNNNIFEKRNIICIGNVNRNCNETYNLEQLQRKYLEETNTDKIILVNSKDLDIFKKDIKSTTYSGNIQYLFGKSSLAAPILASYKRELILPVQSSQVEKVDTELDNYIKQLNLKSKYLTIIASPLEIQQTISLTRSYGEKVVWSIDNTKYGNLDNDLYGFAELKTGRIYGFNVSDISAYIARASFYKNFLDPQNILFIGQGVGSTDINAKLYSAIFNKFNYNTDYKTYSNPAKASDWKDRLLINNDAHGSQYYSTILSEEIPLLKNSLILTASCLTCAFDKLNVDNYGKLFCLQLLRNGSLGGIVSVDNAGFGWDSTRLNGLLLDDLGTVFKKVQNYDHARNKWYIEDLAKTNDYRDLSGDVQFLLGDPTLKYPFQKTILPNTESKIKYNLNNIEIEANIFSYNIKEGEEVYTFIDGTDSFIQAKYGKFFFKIGPINLYSQYLISSLDVDSISYGGIKLVAEQNDNGQKFVYFLLEKDFSKNPLDKIIENQFKISIIKK